MDFCALAHANEACSSLRTPSGARKRGNTSHHPQRVEPVIILTPAAGLPAYSRSRLLRSEDEMEVFLLAWDELDDLIGCIRKVWLGMRIDISAGRSVKH
jgi:hypothetical protein